MLRRLELGAFLSDVPDREVFKVEFDVMLRSYSSYSGAALANDVGIAMYVSLLTIRSSSSSSSSSFTFAEIRQLFAHYIVVQCVRSKRTISADTYDSRIDIVQKLTDE